MATIYDLPLETIGHIFSIAMPVSSCNSEERKERYRFLKAISLVCRSWTPLAQRALWLDVQVLGEEDFDRFLEAGPGRYPVHKLCIDSQTASEESVESILHDVRGVRKLTRMSGVTRLEWLFGKNFKDLKTLRLVHVTHSTSKRSRSRPLPFNLTSLALKCGTRPSSFAVIDALSRQWYFRPMADQRG